MSGDKKELFKGFSIERAGKNDAGFLQSRREFMGAAGGAFGLAFAGLVMPLSARAKEEIEFIQTSCGIENKGKGKVLVAYASKYGTTGGVAEAIAKEVCAAGAGCDVRLAKEVKDLSPYSAVILGGAARSFAWMPEAAMFVRDNEDALSRVPVAFFITCLQVLPQQPAFSDKGRKIKDETPEQKRERILSYLDPVLKRSARVKPVDIGVFAGALDFDKMTRVDKTMMKTMGFVEGDFRDWEAIKSWAGSVSEKLLKG